MYTYLVLYVQRNFFDTMNFNTYLYKIKLV